MVFGHTSSHENLQNICMQAELLDLLTFSIVQYTREMKTRRFGNWICFRPQVKGGEERGCPVMEISSV
jgi:hypothetical protein